MVADRYAGDPISAPRTVRERYDVAAAKAGQRHERDGRHPGNGAARLAARERAGSKATTS